jgi:hypothetical protein
MLRFMTRGARGDNAGSGAGPRRSDATVAFAPLATGAFVLAWLLMALAILPGQSAQAEPAGGVVGNGTAVSCTSAALDKALKGGGNVTFDCGLGRQTIVLTTSKTITLNTTIDGGGKITLDGDESLKLFTVAGGARLTLNNLTLTNGQSSLGGCILVDASTLNTTDVTLSHCAARAGAHSSGDGGAIYASGATLALTDTTLYDNRADGDGGGIYQYGGKTTLSHVNVLTNTAVYTYPNSGGGLYLTATATLVASDSQISGNSFGYNGKGGGIFAYGSYLNLTNVLANNSDGQNGGDGGGLYVELGGITMTGGTANRSHALYDGGGMYLNNTQANLTDVTLSDNRASADGAGIYAYNTNLQLTGVHITDNTSGEDGGGIRCYSCTGSLGLTEIGGNTSDRDGGALSAYHSTLTIDRCEIHHNSVISDRGDAGGIYSDASTLTIARSTINNNTTSGYGGGIYNDESTANMVNVTLSANSAISGGAIYNNSWSTVWSPITLTNVTIKDNWATEGGGLYNFNATHASVSLKNTIIADSLSGGDCQGKAISSAQYSIAGDATCNLQGLTNQNSTNPQLTYLGDFGGPNILTHLPRAGSPAVDAIIGTDYPSQDARGWGRPQGVRADIGAVERTPYDPPDARRLYLPLVSRQ